MANNPTTMGGETSFPVNGLTGAAYWMLFPPGILAVCLLGVWAGDMTVILAAGIAVFGITAQLLACVFIAGVDWEQSQCRQAFDEVEGSLRRLCRDTPEGLGLRRGRETEPIVFKFVRALEAAHRHGIDRDCIPEIVHAVTGELDTWRDRVTPVENSGLIID